MINEKDFAEIVRNMRNRTSRMEHEGDYWDKAEKEQLVRLFKGDIGITEIAVQLQRTEPAVFQQIEKLDLYNRKGNPIRQRKVEKSPECLCGQCQMDQASCPCYQAYLTNREDL